MVFSGHCTELTPAQASKRRSIRLPDHTAPLLGVELRPEACPVHHQSGGLCRRQTESVPERRNWTL